MLPPFLDEIEPGRDVERSNSDGPVEDARGRFWELVEPLNDEIRGS